MMKLRMLTVALTAMVWAGGAQAALFDNIFFFGDSLADAGNNAIALAPQYTPTPISGNGFIPEFPYASGRYTDGPVWAETFAAALGLSANPMLAGGTNYAFGGARTGPLDPTFPVLSVRPPTLTTQSAMFLAQYGNAAAGSALYVVAGGGNDARDAAGAIVGGAPVHETIANAAQEYATNIKGIVDALQQAGAADIVVWNVPDIGKAPAVSMLGPQAAAGASLLAATMNDALFAALMGEPGVKLFDVFTLVNAAVQAPGTYGLSNVTDACAQFDDCDPSAYLFWDGIHPTSAGHALFAEYMLAFVIPEPSTIGLLAVGLVLLVVALRRTATR
jgi:outer membrane lipase/esterase